MHALIAAGGVPEPGDPLYPITQGGPRALVDVAGKAMAQWVVDALSDSTRIDETVIVGLDATSGITSSKPLHFLSDQGGMLANIQAGLDRVRELPRVSTHALYVSCDIPAITSEIVDWRVDTAMRDPSDLDYAAIERSVMEARFPGSKRTYIRLKDHEVCGGDMNVVRLDAASDESVWHRLLEARKSPLRQALLLGVDTLVLFMLGRLTLAHGERLAARKLGIRGRIQLSPYAEIGMDIDKPYQLEILRADLASRASV